MMHVELISAQVIPLRKPLCFISSAIIELQYDEISTSAYLGFQLSSTACTKIPLAMMSQISSAS